MNNIMMNNMDIDNTIITELSPSQLIDLKSNPKPETVFIIKFGATWCGPCQKIKQLCENYFYNINLNYKNITCFDIDVDESIELYLFLKKKRRLSGLPTILAYYGGNTESDYWYIENDSVVGADENLVSQFFERCIQYSTKSDVLIDKMSNTNI